MEKQVLKREARRKKREVIIAITKSNFGGAQKYVYILAKALQNKGFLVKVLLGGNGILKQKLEKEGIGVLTLQSLQRDISILKEVKVFWELIKILKTEKPDIFHLNSSKIGIIGAFAGRLMRIKKIVFTTHGFAFNEDRDFISKIILKIIYWKIFLFSHKTIFVSKETQRQAPTFLLSKKKFEIIYNGIEPINFIPKQEAKEILAQKNPTLNISQKWIGTLAELHPIKRIDLLIQSAKEILKERNDLQFVVFGDGEEYKVLKDQSSDIRKDFVLFGQLEDASKYLKALDLFVLPSKSEAMPLSVLEAMQAQIPIVASPVGGIPEMIPEKCLFYNDNLTKKILENIDLNFQYKAELFDVYKMVENTILLYNQ